VPDQTARDLVAILRRSHDHLSDLVAPLDAEALVLPSYATEWSVAQVLSHLGSGARIFTLILQAGIEGDEAPGGEVFQRIWAEWDAKSPVEMRDDFLVTDEALVSRLESMTDEEVAAFSLPLWGMVLDVAAFARMRLGEHAVHAWDVEVVLDPAALVARDAVEALIDGLGVLAARSGAPADPPFAVRITTIEPARDLLVSAGEPVAIAPFVEGVAYDGHLELPAEAYLRLVYGRLGATAASAAGQSGERGLDDLRAVFPGP
jgi:uncharacterized protein (TIGR03083 family)